jgi:polysaccharide export outer membrane protein
MGSRGHKRGGGRYWVSGAALLALACVIGVAPVAKAQADTGPGSGAGAAAEEPVYRLAPGDRIAVEVFDQPRLSGEQTVRPDGRVNLPLIGGVRAIGRTPRELARRLEEGYTAYLVRPRVTVRMVQATSAAGRGVYVIGRGAPEPRRLRYRAGMRALDVLTAIGGLPETAARDEAYILRTGPDGERRRIPVNLERLQEAGAGRNVAMRPGDVVVIPEGVLEGDWQVGGSVTNSYTFTDNIGLQPDDQADSALIAELAPTVTLSGESGRVQGALTGGLRFRHTAINREDSEVLPRLSGTATVEWARDRFFTDLSARVNQQSTGRAQAVSGTQANQTNQRTVQTYRFSPYLLNRLGRFARMETRYTANATLVEDDRGGRGGAAAGGGTTGDSLENQVSFQLDSGRMFPTFDWTLRALASETSVADGRDTSRREVRLETVYPLSTSLAAIAEVGYQKLYVEDSSGGTGATGTTATGAQQEIDDPLYRAGFRWTPSPDASLRATFGQEDGDRSLALDTSYSFSRKTSLSVSFNEEVATAQERLAERLPRTAADVDRTRLDEVQLREGTTRTRTFRLRGNTAFGRNRLGLTGLYEEEEAGASGGQTLQESYDITLDFSRPLSRDLRLSSGASYSYTDFASGRGVGQAREDDTYVGSLSLSYTGFQAVDLRASYTHTRRDSTSSRAEYRENALTISGTIGF